MRCLRPDSLPCPGGGAGSAREFFCLHDVDRVTERGLRSFHDALAQGRVGVDRVLDVLVGQLAVDREPEFSDEFGGLVADDVRAEDLTVRLADDES